MKVAALIRSGIQEPRLSDPAVSGLDFISPVPA